MRGDAVAFTRLPVTQADKDVFNDRANASRSGSGGSSAAPAAPSIDFPELKPPFAVAGVLAGSDGRLWVQRYVPASDARTHYDVFDRRGAVVLRATVPNGGRIVGFGPKSVYVVRKDADDLQYLQKFPL